MKRWALLRLALLGGSLLGGAIPAAAAEDARECTPVDVRPEFEARTGTRQVRNQDGLGFCYAYATADLLSFHHGTRDRPLHFSALDIGNTYLNRIRRKMVDDGGKLRITDAALSGGDMWGASRESVAHGLCEESNVRSTASGADEIRESINLALDFGDQVRKSGRTASCEAPGALREIFPRLSDDSIREALLQAARVNPLDEVFEVACEPRLRLPAPVLKLTRLKPMGTSTAEGLLQAADAILGRGKPAGIVIDSDSFVRPGCPKGKGGNHAVTLMGRRWKPRPDGTGRCEYLIRNSWGESCDTYGCASVECERVAGESGNRPTGYVWVGAGELNDSIYQTIEIQ